MLIVIPYELYCFRVEEVKRDPMRYDANHKLATRERILVQARRLFRAHGYAGVGLEALMTASGLTRGAFYKHFKSKAELFSEVVADEPDFAQRLRARSGESSEELERGALDVVAGYRPGIERIEDS